MWDISESDAWETHLLDALITLFENIQDTSIVPRLPDIVKHLPNCYQIFNSFLAQAVEKQGITLRLLRLVDAVHAQVKTLHHHEQKDGVFEQFGLKLSV